GENRRREPRAARVDGEDSCHVPAPTCVALRTGPIARRGLPPAVRVPTGDEPSPAPGRSAHRRVGRPAHRGPTPIMAEIRPGVPAAVKKNSSTRATPPGGTCGENVPTTVRGIGRPPAAAGPALSFRKQVARGGPLS